MSKDYENFSIEEIREQVIEEITLYESLYHLLCSNYSPAYLKGSNWYVGESLSEWWLKVEGSMKEYKKKYKKYLYIKEILIYGIPNMT